MISDKTKSADAVSATLERAGALPISIGLPKFTYHVQQIRDGKVIDEWESTNIVTTEGAKDLLDKYFAGSTYTAAWYCGLISSASYTTPPAITNVASNLSAAGNGWAECSASYAPNYSTPGGTARGTVAFSAATGTDPVTKSTSATIDYTFSGAGTVKGAFVATNGTRLNATGVLYSASLFSGDKTVATNDILKVSITISQDI